MDTEVIKNEIKDFLEKMGFGEDLESIELSGGAVLRLNVVVRRDANLLIGEKGGNLVALEYLLKRVIRHKHTKQPFVDVKFTLDINDYRTKRLEYLKNEIKAAAKKVRLYRKEVPLMPMSSFERRIIHLLLAEYPDIITQSIGQEPNRRVIIKPYP